MALDGALARLETTLDALKDKPAEVENVVRRIRQLRFDLQFIVTGADKKFVYWTERRGRGFFVRASPIDVSGLLEDKLFGQVETVVLTSATLSSAGNFSFIRERLGLDKAEDLIAESTFDYQNQAVLYLPPKMPDPRSSEWAQAAAAEVIKIVNATDGRAFVLSTSLAGMQSLYDLVMPELDYPCFLQGSAAKGRLLARFRETPNAVLFATSSFWQGVDVRGEQLSCVIIDKLPFAVPTDPIVAARQRYIEDEGGSSFFEYSVPQAIISLKQGLGRLIRSTTDRGVLAVLDPRLRTKTYGRTFLKSLPPCRVTSEINQLSRIFESPLAHPTDRQHRVGLTLWSAVARLCATPLWMFTTEPRAVATGSHTQLAFNCSSQSALSVGSGRYRSRFCSDGSPRWTLDFALCQTFGHARTI